MFGVLNNFKRLIGANNEDDDVVLFKRLIGANCEENSTFSSRREFSERARKLPPKIVRTPRTEAFTVRGPEALLDRLPGSRHVVDADGFFHFIHSK